MRPIVARDMPLMVGTEFHAGTSLLRDPGILEVETITPFYHLPPLARAFAEIKYNVLILNRTGLGLAQAEQSFSTQGLPTFPTSSRRSSASLKIQCLGQLELFRGTHIKPRRTHDCQ